MHDGMLLVVVALDHELGPAPEPSDLLIVFDGLALHDGNLGGLRMRTIVQIPLEEPENRGMQPFIALLSTLRVLRAALTESGGTKILWMH